MTVTVPRSADFRFDCCNRLWSVFAPVLSLLACLFFAGCTATGEKSSEFRALQAPVSNYATNALSEGDTININFQYSTNFNALQKIGSDGLVNLEGLGQIKAAGKTPLQLQQELTRLYKPQVKDDVITVRVISAASCIYVSGAVLRPGKVPMERPMTVLEGIMEAGGFDPNRAKLSTVRVIRLENRQQRIYYVNIQQVLKGGEENPFYLKPFDIVHVPLKTFNF